jgi:hypothetical protein
MTARIRELVLAPTLSAMRLRKGWGNILFMLSHPFHDEAGERMGQRRRMRKRFLVGAFIVL